MKDKVLYIATHHRIGERMYPLLLKLTEDYLVDIIFTYKMRSDYKWPGDEEIRYNFFNRYRDRFNEMYDAGYNIRSLPQPFDYSFVVYDDNRRSHNMELVYANSKGPIFAANHGNTNQDHAYQHDKTVYDYSFVFGKDDIKADFNIAGGIPSNDALKEYRNVEKKHILIIGNFLGNRNTVLGLKAQDKNFFDSLNLKELNSKYNLPVVIKLKSREDERGYKHNLEYLESIIDSDVDYRVVVDVENDNKFIAESAAVISPGSTLALKPIQLGIPTAIVDGYGQIGTLRNYPYVCQPNQVIEYLSNYNFEDTKEFIENAIEGGLTFNSTKIMFEKIKDVCTHFSR